MSGSKVKLSNGDLIPAFNALSALGSEKFGITFAFKLKQVLTAMRPAIELYQDERKALVEQYAKKDADGKPLVSADGNEYQMDGGEWLPKIKELDSVEAIELSGISAKALIEACEKSDLTISANNLFQLGPLLIDDLEP